MDQCWAKVLGDCHGKITGEHIVSKNLFTGPNLLVTGTPWAEGQTVSIRLDEFVSPILCEKHNNLLSRKVDKEGGSAFKTILEADIFLSHVKKDDPPQILQYKINGHFLERWFIKTAINIFVSDHKDQPWINDQGVSDCPLMLAEAAFGRRALKYPMGLYNYAGTEVGQQKIVKGELGFSPIYLDNKFSGAHFLFAGLDFIIWFSDQELPWVNLRQFHHHMGGIFKAHQTQADLKIQWIKKS